MIDIDGLDEGLASALTEHRPSVNRAQASGPVPAPAPARRAVKASKASKAAKPARVPKPPRPPRAPRVAKAVLPEPEPVPTRSFGAVPVASPAMGVRELLELGLMDEAEVRMAAAVDSRQALTWTTMRALLRGDRDTVAAGMAKLAQDRGAEDDYWVQRFWAAVEWGTEDERYTVLGHCRERAYRFDDVHWWGNLVLLLVVLGKRDEAITAFDEALELVSGRPSDSESLDVVTNLIEGATGLGEPARVTAAGRLLRGPEGRLVVVGDGVVCKGSVDRYHAFVHTAAGRWPQAEECFRKAEAVHRAIGAGPLLARTVQQATGCLAAA